MNAAGSAIHLFSIFCSHLHSYCSTKSVQRSAFSVLHCAYVCTYAHTGAVFVLFRSHRPRNALYLVTFIVPEFPQTFNSVFFLFLHSINNNSHILFLHLLYLLTQKNYIRPVANKLLLSSHSFQMLVIALPLTLFF